MIELALAFLLSGPARPFELIAMMKPIAIEAADSPLRKLQKQRYNELLIAIQKTVNEPVVINAWQEGPEQWHRLFDQIGPFTEAGAALEATPANRVKWFELRVAGLRKLEGVFQTVVDLGKERPQALNYARAARLDAEIELLKLKESLKAGK